MSARTRPGEGPRGGLLVRAGGPAAGRVLVWAGLLLRDQDALGSPSHVPSP